MTKWQALGDDDILKMETRKELTLKKNSEVRWAYWLTKQNLDVAEPLMTVTRRGVYLRILRPPPVLLD
jgi:hypothetical protein